jgi:hypothetical protein
LSELLAGIENFISCCYQLGGSEPAASRVVRLVEDCLMQPNLSNLPKSLKALAGMLLLLTQQKRQYKDKTKAIAVRKRHIPLKYRSSFTIKLSKY